MAVAIRITKKYFVSPVEAFQLVGEESFGADWDPACAHDEESELRRVALENLRAALQSDQVRAFWHLFDSERPLTSIEAAGEFFQIDLKKDCINLSRFAGQPIQCGINADDLREFIRSEGNASTKLTKGAETACLNWLVQMFADEDHVPKREQLRQLALHKFPGLSNAAFSRARDRAISETGRLDLRLSGRPKKPEI